MSTKLEAAPKTKPEAWWRRAAVREEAALAAEIAALTGFVVARPVLASFGDSPETFIARGSEALEVILFGLAVTLLPVVAIATVGVASRRAGAEVRQLVHLLCVGVLSGLGAMQVLRLETRTSLLMAAGVGLAVGTAIAVLRWRAELARHFLRYAGVASVLFLVQFLALSPASSLVRGGRSAGVDDAVTATVQAAVGDDAPPVVVIVLDALPTASLLDGEGQIDAEVFPNLAALADDGTWYRNHTTVAQYTLKAVPAILSGTLPEDDVAPVAGSYPRNLFTLLGGVYDLHVQEQITAVCPTSLCPDATEGELAPLLNDANRLWQDTFRRGGEIELVPGAFDRRYDQFAEWVDGLDLEDDQPDLLFYHLLLPHGGWEFLPGGDTYDASWPPHGLGGTTWGAAGMDVAMQRHVLQTQAVDDLLGQLFDRLRSAGLYDDALIAVTADHGVAFRADEPWRGLAEAQADQIMWTPLIVKQPGQTRGAVDDSNVQTIDILPTIVDGLGIDRDELGWEFDGQVPGEGPDRDPDDKAILDWRVGTFHADEEDDGVVHVDGEEALARVLATDMVEGTGADGPWKRTEYGDQLGRSVSDLTEGDPVEDISVDLHTLDRFEDIDLEDPFLEILGFSWMPPDAVVAVAANGEIAGLTTPRTTVFGTALVHALLSPDSLVEGENEIELFLIDGPADDPVLHPIEIGPLAEV